MLATRQVLGNMTRGRTLAGAASGIRRMATVSDNPLDKKVSLELIGAVLYLISMLELGSWLCCCVGSIGRRHSALASWAANQLAIPRLASY
jgi:methyl coenzyme M reductase alpha subunit